MPRGDGRKYGERRPQRKRLTIGQYIPKGLQRRLEWWNNLGTPAGEKATQVNSKLKYTNYDGILDYRKPGSQQR